MPEKRYIGIKELSKYMDVKVSTLYSWVNMRKKPYTKVGRLVKFDIVKIDDWLKKREVKPFRWD